MIDALFQIYAYGFLGTFCISAAWGAYYNASNWRGLLAMASGLSILWPMTVVVLVYVFLDELNNS